MTTGNTSKPGNTSEPGNTLEQGYLNEIKWTADGLVPAIAQDSHTGKILMMAWMNRESLALTVREGQAVYWSRSRGQLWRKGETSGHTQAVREIKLDCDADVLILSVEQRGGIACHTGRESCFFRTLESGRWIENTPAPEGSNRKDEIS